VFFGSWKVEEVDANTKREGIEETSGSKIGLSSSMVWLHFRIAEGS
jgi:hypothetical protein